MINKTQASEKYLNLLKNQTWKKPDSIQLNSNISTFLINQGRLKEAIPYLVKVLNSISDKQETKYHIDNRPIRLIDRVTLFNKELEKDLKKTNQFNKEKINLKKRIKNVNPLPQKSNVNNNEENKSILTTKYIGERVEIGEGIQVSILDTHNRSARLKITLPKQIIVNQVYDYDNIITQNRKSVNSNFEKLKLIIKQKIKLADL